MVSDGSLSFKRQGTVLCLLRGKSRAAQGGRFCVLCIRKDDSKSNLGMVRSVQWLTIVSWDFRGCRGSPLPGALLSCLGKKVSKEAARGPSVWSSDSPDGQRGKPIGFPGIQGFPCFPLWKPLAVDCRVPLFGYAGSINWNLRAVPADNSHIRFL